MAEPDIGADALAAMIHGLMGELNTCLEGTIVSYANGVAVVQPRGERSYSDGESVAYPQIHSARVSWPTFANGRAVVKGPIRQGDPCLLIFAQQAVDGSDDLRRHDLTDCEVLMVNRGTVTDVATDNDSLYMAFGESFIRITEAGDVLVNARNFNVTASAAARVDTPTTTMTGTTVSEGPLTGQSGIAVSGGHPDARGGESSIGGSVSVEKQLTVDGLEVVGHTHANPEGGDVGPAKNGENTEDEGEQ
jgi:hypothetical protein